MKYFLFLLLSFFSVGASAQDVIVKKNGSTILCKILEVGTSEVKYKKHSNPKGPTYIISKKDILSINYKNGEKDMFAEDSEDSKQENRNNSNESNNPKYIQKGPSVENSKQIERYNKRYRIGEKYEISKKSASSCLTTWGVAPSSIMSNDDIEILFEDKIDESFRFEYILIVKNRTDHILYIDRGNSFRVSKNENFCYYNGTQVSTSHGTGGGASVNLGGIAGAAGIGGLVGGLASGINVGGGVSNSSSMTIGQQRFLVLPPHGQAALAKDNDIKGNKLDKNERFVQLIKDINPPIHKGEVLNYDESNTPYTIDYLITYSFNQNFQTYSILNTRLYLKQIFGTPLGFWSKPESIQNALKRRISDVDKYCIVGYIGGNFIVSRLME